jgi:hypothetical protein
MLWKQVEAAEKRPRLGEGSCKQDVTSGVICLVHGQSMS